MAEENQTTHKRRVRYSGKYPKKFEEKYKNVLTNADGSVILKSQRNKKTKT